MKIDEFLYKNRNYLILPFILVGLVFSKPETDLLQFGLILVGFGELMRLLGISYTGADKTEFDATNTTLVTNGGSAACSRRACSISTARGLGA